MPKGRPPKPTALKVFEGNRGRQTLNQNEPKPTKGVPSCPTWLKGEAKREWNRVTKELHRIGVLTQIDRAIAAAYCQAWADFVWAVAELSENGRIITGGKNDYVMPHPAVAIKRQAGKELQEFGNLLGLNPSARSRLHVVPTNDGKSKFEGLLA